MLVIAWQALHVLNCCCLSNIFTEAITISITAIQTYSICRLLKKNQCSHCPHFDEPQPVPFHGFSSISLIAVPFCLFAVFFPKYFAMVYAYLQQELTWISKHKLVKQQGYFLQGKEDYSHHNTKAILPTTWWRACLMPPSSKTATDVPRMQPGTLPISI